MIKIRRNSTRCNSNVVLNIGVFQVILKSIAKCTGCNGRLEFVETGKVGGCAPYLHLKCTKCVSGKKFWRINGYTKTKRTIGSSDIPKRNTMVFSSVLAGRIMGVGWHKLFAYHSMMNIPGPLASRNFGIVQSELLLVAEFVAEESMLKARDNLRTLHGTDSSEDYVTTVGKFDGAYQQRSGKSGGGFSRCAYSACIIAETGKVISYGIACNSCTVCTRINNRFPNNAIDCDEYQSEKETHKIVCPAEYAELSSVHLESAIAPQVVSHALERGVVFSAIVTDRDNKKHDTVES